MSNFNPIEISVTLMRDGSSNDDDQLFGFDELYEGMKVPSTSIELLLMTLNNC